MSRVCNTCSGTGVVKNLHSWVGGGTREQPCWNCHEAPVAPQQAAPAVPYKDGTPHLSVGDSSFESWYESYNPAHKSDKQRARDAYAAGMGDPLVVAAPQQGVQEPDFWTVCEWL